MKDPDAEWKSAAVGRYKNGDTIRTDTIRFTEYTSAMGQLTSQMLYDHATDPGEDVNVAEPRRDLIMGLAEELHGIMGQDGQLPPTGHKNDAK